MDILWSKISISAPYLDYVPVMKMLRIGELIMCIKAAIIFPEFTISES